MNGSLKGGLKYTRSQPGRDALEGYVDADYARNVDTRKSLLGFVFTLFGTAVYHERTKHIDIRLHFVRDMIETKEIMVEKVESEENPADMFTKSLPRSRFKHCLDLIIFIEA